MLWKNKLYSTVITCCLGLTISHSQDKHIPEKLPDDRLRLGVGFQLELDLGMVGYCPKVKSCKKRIGDWQYGMAVSGSVGIGYRYDPFIPTYHLGFRFSRGRGMLGNSGSYNLKEESQFELNNAFHFIFDWGKHEFVQRQFQYFTSHHVSSLYINSSGYFSLGTILISNARRRGMQRSGSVGLAIKDFSMYYTNDGGAVMQQLMLGDDWDRYWNGGLSVYIKLGNDSLLKKDIVFSYDRFTGFSENSYRYSGQMKFNYVSYENEKEKTYNKGVWKTEYRDHVHGYNAYVSFNEFRRIDLQHGLHRIGFFSYHPNYLNWSIHAGGSITNSNRFNY